MCPKNIVLINADNDVIAFITKYLQGHRKIYPKTFKGWENNAESL